MRAMPRPTSTASPPEIHGPEVLAAAGRLRQWIAAQHLLVGSRLPSERELARLAGTSRQTLQRALRICEFEGVVRMSSDRIREVGPALHERRSPIAGAVCVVTDPTLRTMSTTGMHGHPQRIQRGLEQALGSLGARLMTLPPERISDDALVMLAGLAPRGLIVLQEAAKHERSQALMTAARFERIPVVVQADSLDNDVVERLAADLVLSDHAAGAAALVTWAFQRGRCRPQILIERQLGDEHLPWWQHQRLRGYRQACLAHGLQPRHPLWCLRLPRAGQEFTAEFFDAQVRMTVGCLADAFLAGEPPDAVLLTSDGQAVDTAAALLCLGHEPYRTVDLLGYDNNWKTLDWATKHADFPPSASVEQVPEHLGASLVDVLLEREKRGPHAVQIRRLVTPQLVVRATGA